MYTKHSCLIHIAQQIIERGIDVIVIAPFLVFDQQMDADQFIEVARGGDAADPQFRHDKIHLRVRVTKKVIEQILAVNLGQFSAHFLLEGQHQVADALNEQHGLPSCLLHPLQHKNGSFGFHEALQRLYRTELSSDFSG